MRQPEIRDPGLIGYSPKESKEARASAVSPQIGAGYVYLPDASLNPWVNGFLAECDSFPRGANDDQVDAMTQALKHLTGEGGWFSREQLEKCSVADIKIGREGKGSSEAILVARLKNA